MTKANKALARQWLDEFWNGNLALADAILAPGYVRHDPDGPMIGPDAYRRFVAGIRTEFPDLRFTAEDLIAEGDRVVVRWTATGTHTPTNQRITFPGMDILRIRAEKIVESWPCYDRLSIEQQLGAPAQHGQSGG